MTGLDISRSTNAAMSTSQQVSICLTTDRIEQKPMIAENQPKKEKGWRRVGQMERSEIDKVERVVEENWEAPILLQIACSMCPYFIYMCSV